MVTSLVVRTLLRQKGSINLNIKEGYELGKLRVFTLGYHV